MIINFSKLLARHGTGVYKRFGGSLEEQHLANAQKPVCGEGLAG